MHALGYLGWIFAAFLIASIKPVPIGTGYGNGGSPDAGGINSGRQNYAPPAPPVDPRSWDHDTPPKREKRARHPKGDYTDAIWKVTGPTGTGTAFVVGLSPVGFTLAVTSAHCVKDEMAQYKLSGGMNGEHSEFDGFTVIATNVENDVALLQGPIVKPYRAIPINGWVHGDVGVEVRIAGYGGGRFSEHYAMITGTRRVSSEVLGTDGNEPEAWAVDKVAVHGHSGSPVINPNDHLVGVLATTSPTMNEIIHVRYIRWLLRDAGYSELIDRRLPERTQLLTEH